MAGDAEGETQVYEAVRLLGVLAGGRCALRWGFPFESAHRETGRRIGQKVGHQMTDKRSAADRVREKASYIEQRLKTGRVNCYGLPEELRAIATEIESSDTRAEQAWDFVRKQAEKRCHGCYHTKDKLVWTQECAECKYNATCHIKEARRILAEKQAGVKRCSKCSRPVADGKKCAKCTRYAGDEKQAGKDGE